jgi:hypothetical protein
MALLNRPPPLQGETTDEEGRSRIAPGIHKMIQEALCSQEEAWEKGEKRMTRQIKISVLALALALALTPGAFAGLSAVSPIFNPVNTSNGFPQWYTDANGVTLELPVPPIGDGLGVTPPTMIFGPLSTLSNAYAQLAGFDTEAFYFNAVSPKTFATKWGKVTALFGIEASYANLVPTAGQQVVFARVRLTAPNIQVAGTYTFRHPWGVETITVTTADLNQNKGKGIKFTKDFGATLGWVSDGAGGWLPVASPGGFYTVLDPANTMSTFLRAVSPAPPAQWVGDGVTPATFTGSPVAYNKIRLEAPVGTDLDGKGNSFIESTQMVISGHIPLTLTIPLPLSVDRVTCSYINKVENIDLFLTSKQGATVTVTDSALGTVLATGSVTDVSGKHYKSFPGTAKAITVAVSDPAGAFTSTSKAANVVDYVNITRPTYSLGTNTLTVQATSSDFIKHPLTPPVLTVTGFGTMTLNTTSGVYSLSVLMTVPLPPSISVTSTVGGSDTATVAIVP